MKVIAEASIREAYGKILVEMGRTDPNIVVLDSDLSHSTMTRYFAESFPERFFNCGLAEQNMVGIAAGLAATGKTVFASTFSIFATGRCFDQLRVSLSQPKLNVKIVATHGGITVGEDGASHHAVEDLALACSLLGFSVIVPADAIEAVEAIKFAAVTRSPFYIRLMRPKVPLVYTPDYRFDFGKAVTLRQGKDVTVIAIGIMVARALEAADRLYARGIDCRVLNMPTLKPLDAETIVRAASETGSILVAEEHLQHGGLGSQVARVIVREKPVPMAFLNIGDVYVKSGKAEELLEKQGLTADGIERGVIALLSKKQRLQ